MKKLPTELQYQKITPIAFPSIYKQWELSPMSSNKQWANNDVVRFNMQNLGNGVMDPYRSYIQISVACNEKQTPVGLLQIDNSAQSFIQQLIIYSNNAQVERVTHYSVLAAYLNDIGLNQFVTEGRQMEGLGYCSFATPPFSKPTNGAQSLRYGGIQKPVLITDSVPLIHPTIGKSLLDLSKASDAGQQTFYNASKICKGHLSNSNPYIFPNDLSFPDQTYVYAQDDCLSKQGYLNNMRGQYVANYQNERFIDATNSIPNVCLGLDQSVHQSTYPFAYDPKIPYKTNVYNQISLKLQGQNNEDAQTQVVSVNCSNIGFSTLFSPAFSKGTFQPFISPTVPQNQIQQGLILKTKQPIMFRRFKIPLLSGICGILIDKNSFKLIPLAALNTVLMELTLDPYAMFTSGLCDYSESDLNGINVQQKRNYIITRIQYRLQTYHYSDIEVNQYIRDSLTKQITFTSTMWSLGNMYQIPGGTPVNNNYIVGCTSLFLNQIICLFVPNDYQRYSYCRKHYRLSNCVRKFWARIGIDYWPPQPYKGNGGNPYASINDFQSDNSVYLQNLYWAHQYMFDLTNPMPRINTFNFALSQRPYDPTNKNTFYPQGLYNNPNFVFQNSSFNFDTALGMSWIHQNRCVGRAAYIIPFASYANSQELLQGINVKGVNNLEVIFETDTQNIFPRDQSLYIFCKSSVAVALTLNGINVYGR